MSDFAFSLPAGDSASFVLTLSDSSWNPANLTGWALTFTAGSIVKTSALGQVVVSGGGSVVTVTIAAGDFATAGELDASLVATLEAQQATWFGTVVVTSSSTHRNLTTLAKAKAQLGLTDVADMDLEILSTLVTSSSAWVVSQLGRPVLSASYTETKDGNGGTRVLLDKCPPTDDSPPISVTSVTVDGTVIPARADVSTSDTNPSGWVLRDYHIDLSGHTFTKGTANVVIVYTVGYAACPDDLEQAVLEHIAFKYRRRTNLGLGSASAGGEAVSYSDAGVIAGINDVLDLYRALGVA